MGFRATSWAIKQVCPSGTAKAVLLALSHYTNDDTGGCWPSIATIAGDLQLAERTVRYAIIDLERAGVIRVVARFTRRGGQTSNEYQLPADKFPEARQQRRPAPAADDSEGAAPGDRNPVHDVQPNRKEGTGKREHPPEDQPPPLREGGGRGKTLVDSDSTEPPGFAEFYAAYPLKRGRGQARRAWRQALKRATAEEIMAGVRRYAEEVAADKRPGAERYIAHASTWLNGERWLDEGVKRGDNSEEFWNEVERQINERQQREAARADAEAA